MNLREGAIAGVVQLGLAGAAATLGGALGGRADAVSVGGFVAVGALAVALEVGAQRADDAVVDDETMRWLAQATSVGVFLLLVGGAVELAWRGGARVPQEVAPLVIACSGSALRALAIHTLGPAFRSGLAIPETGLSSRGPYRVLRHPSEVGLWLLSAGMLIASPGVATLSGACVVIVSSLWRIRLEDAFLRSARAQ